jgi:hypothetical protein
MSEYMSHAPIAFQTENVTLMPPTVLICVIAFSAAPALHEPPLQHADHFAA